MQSIRRAPVIFLTIVAATVMGCGPPYRVAEVDGVLLIKGKPAGKVYIQFLPDGDKNTKGPTSSADTDADGRFTLQLMEGPGKTPRMGAVVGWHRIVLSDK